MAYANQLKAYEQKLADLKAKCDEAEKNKITAEANLKIYQEQRDNLIAECEQYAGVPIDQVSELLEQKVIELSSIMTELESIDFRTKVITEEDVQKVEAVMQKYNIIPAEV